MSSFSTEIAKYITPKTSVESRQYDTIYISIGGKINEPTVKFRNPATLSDYAFASNAQYQMVPAFIRYPKTRITSLVIVVDDFSDSQLRELNKAAIREIQLKHPHISIALYDIRITIKNVNEFAKSLVDWIVDQNVAPEKCMIANYLRFRGCPCVTDSQLENAVPRIIQLALNETKVYANILYNWFGYQYYTYNILFLYNEYNVYILSHLSTLALFAECCDLTQVVSGNVSNIFMYDIAREPKNAKVLFHFLKYAVDITSYAKPSIPFYSRLYEYVPKYATDLESYPMQ
jgi:hypothetical protein